MLTGHQIRQARKPLGWGRLRFSRAARVPESLMEAVESTDGPAWLTDGQEGNIRRTCEEGGIRFEIDGEGQPTAVLARTVT